MAPGDLRAIKLRGLIRRVIGPLWPELWVVRSDQAGKSSINVVRLIFALYVFATKVIRDRSSGLGGGFAERGPATRRLALSGGNGAVGRGLWPVPRPVPRDPGRR